MPQTRNTEGIDLLSSDLVGRREASYALGNVLSNYLMIPGLRGFWPFSSVNETGQALDLSGQARTLSNAGTTTFGLSGLLSYADFNGTNQYLYRADEAGLDITGPLAFGGWFYFDALPTSINFCGKLGASGNYAYSIQLNASNYPGVYVSGNGTALTGSFSTTAAVISEWYFVAARYVASTELVAFVSLATEPYSLVKYTNTTTIPAAIHNSSAQFQIGGNSANSQYMNGRAALCWLAGANVPDAWFHHLHQQTKSLFSM